MDFQRRGKRVTLRMMHFPEQGHIVADLQSKLWVRRGLYHGAYYRVGSALVNSCGTPGTSLEVSHHRPSAHWSGDLVKLDKAALWRMPSGDSALCRQLRLLSPSVPNNKAACIDLFTPGNKPARQVIQPALAGVRKVRLESGECLGQSSWW